MTREQATKKLKALKELAEKGVGGEKEGARRLYEKLKRKYGIDEKDLQKDHRKKQSDVIDLFRGAVAVKMLREEQKECDDCPCSYGKKECEECGTYENIQRICLQLEKMSREREVEEEE